MSLDRTVVIELGAPFGLDSAGLAPLAERVQRAVMSGMKVIGVCRGPSWRTSNDVAAAERLGPGADVHARALVIGSGAVDASMRLAGILSDRGVRVAKVDAERTAVRTRGHALDAQPRRMSAASFSRSLSTHDVVLVPGGVGIDDCERATHLGEAGSVLTALFIADVFGLPIQLAEPLFATSGLDSIGARKVRLFANRRGFGASRLIEHAARSDGQEARSERIAIRA